MTGARDTAWVVEQARAAGFSLCGVARAEDFPELERLPEWLARGYAGQMSYLADPRRSAVASLLEGARSLIVCALLYNTARPHTAEMAVPYASSNVYRQEEGVRMSADAAMAGGAPATGDEGPRGWISRYAWGDDYHRVLGERLDQLVAAMRAGIAEPFKARAYVDTGPVSERVAAKHAGLGWLGKNTSLIHPELGSWLFLGVVVTTLELIPSLGSADVPQPDLCGQCTLCLDACPTGAFVEAGVLDARRCISYLTIEHRGSLPEELRGAMGAHVFGCDICQDVCPYNRGAPLSALAEFTPRPLEERGALELFAPRLEWLAALTEEEYRRVFRGSAMKRAKYQGLVRNACVALGNAGRQLEPAARERVCALLSRLSVSPDGVIAEHAAWALRRLAEA
ncbi:MAG TPA: tRNA epoxyqueuosine(34) reductase QueG [Candidatus Acidoferrales bacterium]|nr:tRNA epoxyqueuosine(34) reductase QueG [Candidatus Acidoferrales bacterium]